MESLLANLRQSAHGLANESEALLALADDIEALYSMPVATLEEPVKSISQRLYERAREFIGQSEVTGPKSNPKILEWVHRRDRLSWVKDDSKIAWCGLFVGAMVQDCGLTDIPDTPEMARDWLNVGEHVESKDAEPGDIVVLWRGSPSSWKGHVAFYEDSNALNGVKLLGGNQRNTVSVVTYARNQVLGIRRLTK